MIGTQVGAYRVLEQIGEGGMGAVYLAEHAMLGRRAAIKVLHPSFSMRPEIVTRFFNEARAATAIADPGIVQIFDFGNHVDGSAYIVMELLNGETLDKRIRTRGTVAVPDALRFIRQVATSLAAAHERGIIHRDLKPENIFLVRDPEVEGGERPKVLDFGIAKLTGDGVAAKTQTSAMMGTPMFMSPEQCRGAGGVDARSDIYALGCILFTTLTGRPVFDGEGVGDIIAAHMREPAPAPSTFAPGIPPQIDQLVLRCLEKDPARRPQTMRELADLLQTLRMSGASMSFPAARPPTAPSGVGGSTTLSSAAGARSGITASAPPQPSSRGFVIAGVGVVLAAGAAIAFVATRSKSDAKNDARPEATDEPKSAALPAPAPAPPTPTPEPPKAAPPDAPVDTTDAALLASMRTVQSAFATWAPARAGAPCPDASMLGVTGLDPWSKPMTITCTDQPANQIIGILSSGPDGAFGTTDDVSSWSVDRDLASSLRGPRWKTIATPPPDLPARRKTGSKKAEPTVTTPKPPQVQYDEFGIPIQRQ